MMDPYVQALAYERAGYARSARPDRVIPVDEELAKLGWCVDGDGKLVEVDKVTRSAVKVAEAVTPGRPVRERRPLKAPERVVED